MAAECTNLLQYFTSDGTEIATSATSYNPGGTVNVRSLFVVGRGKILYLPFRLNGRSVIFNFGYSAPHNGQMVERW
jgi:hypothetical protein